MNGTWFEDELILSDQTIDRIRSELPKPIRGVPSPGVEDYVREARGIVRAQRPDWGELSQAETKKILNSGRQARFFKVRLIFEFEIPNENYKRGVRFIYGCCSAYLRPTGGFGSPEVYDLFPRDEFNGEPQKVSLKFGPEISLDKVGVSIGEIGTEIAVGQVTPVIAGFFGDNKIEPHWEIRPKEKSLLGRQYMWLVVMIPTECSGFRLASRVEAVIQTRFGPFSIGPKEAAWDNRPSILID